MGLDGLPGTGDFGEGNGRPDVGRDANNNITAEPKAHLPGSMAAWRRLSAAGTTAQ